MGLSLIKYARRLVVVVGAFGDNDGVAETAIVISPVVATLEMIGTVTVSVDVPTGNATDSLKAAKSGLATGVGGPALSDSIARAIDSSIPLPTT